MNSLFLCLFIMVSVCYAGTVSIVSYNNSDSCAGTSVLTQVTLQAGLFSDCNSITADNTFFDPSLNLVGKYFYVTACNYQNSGNAVIAVTTTCPPTSTGVLYGVYVFPMYCSVITPASSGVAVSQSVTCSSSFSIANNTGILSAVGVSSRKESYYNSNNCDSYVTASYWGYSVIPCVSTFFNGLCVGFSGYFRNTTTLFLTTICSNFPDLSTGISSGKAGTVSIIFSAILIIFLSVIF